MTQEQYWESRISGLQDCSVITHDRESNLTSYEEAILLLKTTVSGKILQMSKKSPYAVHILFSAVISWLLHKHTGHERIAIGTPVLYPEAENEQKESVLPLILDIDASMPVKDFIVYIQSEYGKVMQNRYNSALLDVKTDIQSDDAKSLPLFDVVVCHEKMHSACILRQTTPGIFVIISQNEKEIHCRIRYKSNFYRQQTIKTILGQMEVVLDQFMHAVSRPLKTVTMLTEKDRSMLLNDFNQTTMPVPYHSVPKIVDGYALTQGDRIAVQCHEMRVSYQKLKQWSDRLVDIIRGELHAHQGMKIAALMERSIYTIPVILAIWKAGGVYLPLDPLYPEERIEQIIGDAGIQIVLCDTENGIKIKQMECGHQRCTVFDAQAFYTHLVDEASSAVERQVQYDDPGPNDLAYIIYTSGSTGQPKGVMIEHKGMVNHIHAKIMDLQISRQSIIAQNASQCFDISIWQFFTALLAGGMTVIYPQQIIHEPKLFVQALLTDGITVLEVVPSYLKLLLDILQSTEEVSWKALKFLVVTGEELKAYLVHEWMTRFPGVKMVNAYGPTEASDDITHYVIDQPPRTEWVPIGKPVLNMRIYILDHEMQLCPVGVKGMLYVSGVGVGQGYINDPEKTDKAFVHNPFACSGHEICYNTGDVACWLPNGDIRFFGRLDHQIKIRGYRIECAEIENKLLQLPEVQEVAVTGTKDQNGDYLCAYYVTTNHVELTVQTLNSHLRASLPAYMIPTHYIHVENNLPLTPNGKVNLKALPHPNEKKGSRNAENTNKDSYLVQVMKEIYAEVLHHPITDEQAHFFELGGDSIRAMQAVARFRARGLSVTLKDLYEYPKIEQLKETVHLQTVQSSLSMTPDAILLSPAQWDLYARYGEFPDQYNQSVLLFRAQGWNESVVQAAWKSIMNHHDVLRMRLHQADQCISVTVSAAEEAIYHAAVFSISGKAAGEEIKNICDALQRAIHIKTGCLSAVGILKTPDEGDYLCIVIHHLMVDGVSWRIILEDFEVAYQAAILSQLICLPSKTASYWQWTYETAQCIEKKAFDMTEEGFWQSMSAAVKTNLQAVEKQEETPRTIADTEVAEIALNQESTGYLLYVAGRHDVDMQSLQLAALLQSLAEIEGVQRISIDMEGHGRENMLSELLLDRTVGWFTAVYPFCFQVMQEPLLHFTQWIKRELGQVKCKNLYNALQYIGKSMQEIKKPTIPDFFFNYLGHFDNDQRYDMFQIVDMNMGDIKKNMCMGNNLSTQLASFYAVAVTSEIVNGILRLSFQYQTPRYTTETMDRLINAVKSKLEELGGSFAGEFLYEASDAQKRMYVLHKRNINSLAYNIPYAVTLSGTVDIQKIQQAFTRLIVRHEALRTSFRYIYSENRLMQEIADHPRWEMQYAHAGDRSIEEILHEFIRPFSLDTAPLFRALLIQTEADKYILCLDLHHSVGDGISMMILLRDLLHIYQGGKSPSTVAQYKEVGQDHKKYLCSEAFSHQEKVWLDMFQDMKRVAVFPTDFVRSANPNTAGNDIYFTIQQELLSSLRQVAAKHKVSIHVVLLAAYFILFYSFSNETDLTVGLPVSGRRKKEYEDVIGLFINTLVFRSRIEKELTLSAYLQQIQQQMHLCLENQDYPYELLQQLPLCNESEQRQLFSTFFNYINYGFMRFPEGDGQLKIKPFNLPSNEAKFDMTLYLYDEGDHIEGVCNYQTALFTKNTIQHVLQEYLGILSKLIKNPQGTIAEIARRKPIVYTKYLPTTCFEAKRKNLLHYFDQICSDLPDETILYEGDERITYREMDLRSDGIAARLIQQYGQQPRSIRIVLLFDQNIYAIQAMIGVLKTGAVFIPVSLDHPVERISYILQDAKASIVLTEEKYKAVAETAIGLSGQPVIMICMEEALEESARFPAKYSEAAEDDIAYILYTSGSTGKPKGVIQRHNCVAHYVLQYIEQAQLKQGDRISLVSSFGHDAFIIDAFSALFSGAAMVSYHLAKEGILPFLQLMETARITVLHCVPTVFRVILNNMPGKKRIDLLTKQLRLIILGGEAVQVSDIICWQDVPDGCEFMNLYGCSEASIISIYKIPKQRRHDMATVPMGALLPGMQLHIMKPDGSDACINERGEIVITSEHIADSYWNHPAETQRAFRQCGDGRRCYHTGDMAYIGFDGELYFAGRADRQVQIRGHRVELPEIEAVIQSIPGLVQTVVTYNRQGERQPSLVAFYQCDTDFYLDEAMIRDILRLRLPPYMMPDDMVQLDQFPVTVSGKIDYEALKNREQPVKYLSSCAMPETEMEQSIYHLFQQVVAAENLGIDDNFFVIGGNSLSALKLEAEFEIQQIPLDYKAIYLYKTVRALAAAAMQKEKDSECDITKHRAV